MRGWGAGWGRGGGAGVGSGAGGVGSGAVRGSFSTISTVMGCGAVEPSSVWSSGRVIRVASSKVCAITDNANAIVILRFDFTMRAAGLAAPQDDHVPRHRDRDADPGERMPAKALEGGRDHQADDGHHDPNISRAGAADPLDHLDLPTKNDARPYHPEIE